jgi:hypothetical protein
MRTRNWANWSVLGLQVFLQIFLIFSKTSKWPLAINYLFSLWAIFQLSKDWALQRLSDRVVSDARSYLELKDKAKL